MAKYKNCGHYEGLCPCLKCKKFRVDCTGCLTADYKVCAVDTDRLCDVAKKFCESGRKDKDGVTDG